MEMRVVMEFYEGMLNRYVENELHAIHCRFLLNHHKHTNVLKDFIDKLDKNYGYFNNVKYSDYAKIADFMVKNNTEFVISAISAIEVFIKEYKSVFPKTMNELVKRCNNLMRRRNAIYDNEYDERY